MSEIILEYSDTCYLMHLNKEHQLLYSLSENRALPTDARLSEMPVEAFWADIDENGTLYILAYTKHKALMYYSISNGKITSSNLARINSPDQTLRTPMIIYNKGVVEVYYVVKNSFGSVAVCYRRVNNNWSGSKLYSSNGELEIATYDKGTKRLFLQERGSGGFKLLELYEGNVSTVAASSMPFHSVHSCNDMLMYENINQIFFNKQLLASGCNPCLHIEDNNIFVLYEKEGKYYKLVNNSDVWQAPQFITDNEKKEYKYYTYITPWVITTILTTPFPYIQLPKADPPDPAEAKQDDSDLLLALQNKIQMLEEEVYMHQRSIFALQAEVKALKAKARQ